MADEPKIVMVRSEQDLTDEERAVLACLHPGAVFVAGEPRTGAELREMVDPKRDGVYLRMTALPEPCIDAGVPCYYRDPKTGELRRLTGITLQSVPVVPPPE